MRMYSMVIRTPKDHRLPSYFVFGRWWNIKTTKDFDNLLLLLSNRTKHDKKGRIVCIGRPQYNMTEQKRLFVVKMGHDGILWYNLYPLGQTARLQLIPS